MKLTSRKVSLLLAAVFSLTVVSAGCSSQKQSNSANDSIPASSTAQKKPVTLKFISWEITAKDSNERVAKAFAEKYPDIKVEYEYASENNNTDYLKKMDLYLLSGEPVDIIMQPGIQEHYTRAYNNVFEPLDEYIKTEGIKYEDTYTFSAKVDGKIYGLPGDMKLWFVMLNKKLLDAAGLPVPKLDWTWDDYRDYAKKLTRGEGANKQYGSYMHVWDTLANLGLYSSKVGTPFWKDANTHNLDDPNLKDWMQFKYDMENVDNTQMKFFEEKSTNIAYRDVFYKGRAAMLPIGTWMIGEMTDTAKYPHDFVTTFAPLPRWRNSPEGRTVADSLFYTISKNSKNKSEAYKFIRFYTTEGQDIKAMNLSAQKGADNGKITDIIIKGHENLYDVAALKAVLNNPKRFDNVFDVVPKTDKAVKDIFMEEYEKFMVGGQKIDNTMANMKKRADEAVKASK